MSANAYLDSLIAKAGDVRGSNSVRFRHRVGGRDAEKNLMAGLLSQFSQNVIDGGLGEPDPLKDIPNLRYWRGTKDISTCGMYLDTACTMPITAEWDEIKGLKDEVHGTIVATQSNSAKCYLARVAADGSWYFEGDGIDDTMDPALSMNGEVNYTVIMRSVTSTANNYWGPIESDINGARWGFFNSGESSFSITGDGQPQSVRRSGVNITPPTNSLSPFDEWMALTVRTAAPTGVQGRYFGQLGLTWFGNWRCSFIFIHAVSPDAGDVTTVDAYANTIIPVEI